MLQKQLSATQKMQSLKKQYKIYFICPIIVWIHPVAKPTMASTTRTSKMISHIEMPARLPGPATADGLRPSNLFVSTGLKSRVLISRPAYNDIKLSASACEFTTCSAIKSSLSPRTSKACSATGNSSLLSSIVFLAW